MVMKYKDFMPIETNRISKPNVAKCILNSSIKFSKGEMLSVMKNKDCLLDYIDHINKTDGIFKMITANCIVNRSTTLGERSKRDIDMKQI